MSPIQKKPICFTREGMIFLAMQLLPKKHYVLCVAQLHMHALKIHKSALKATSDNSYMLEIFLMEHKNVPGMISDTAHAVINL